MHTPSITLPRETRGIALMTTSVVLFTATSLLLGYIHKTHSISGWTASAYRAAIGLMVVFAMQKQTGKLCIERVFTRPLLFTRGFVGGLTIPVFYITIMELGPGRAGMIGGSYPLFAATFALCFLGEPVSRRDYFYMGLALLGLAGVFADDGLGTAKPLFDFIALTGAAAAGICVVLIRHLRHTETTSNIFAAQCVFALLLGLAGAGGDIFIDDPVALALILIASFTVVAAQLCLTEAFRHISVAKGSTLQMLTPACTAVGSAILLHEVFSPLEILGGCAILYSSYRIVVGKAAAQPTIVFRENLEKSAPCGQVVQSLATSATEENLSDPPPGSVTSVASSDAGAGGLNSGRWHGSARGCGKELIDE